MMKLRLSLQHLIFIAFFWAMPTATLCLLDDGRHLGFIEVIKTYLLFIVGGFCFALLTYPIFIIVHKKRETTTRVFLSEYYCTDIYARMKRLLLSRYFLVGIFCIITTVFFFREISTTNLLSITTIGIRYSIAILTAFFVKYFIISAHSLMHTLVNRVEQTNHTQKAIKYFIWLLFAYFIHVLVIGLGLGTVDLVLKKLICNLPFKFTELSVSENIFRIYGKTITCGCIVSTCIFLCRFNKKRKDIERKSIINEVEIYA